MKRRAFAVAFVVVLALMTGSCDTESFGTEKTRITITEQPEEKLHTEGEDAECEVVFKPYSGEHSSMFLTKSDKIAVISPSALPGREQADSVIKGLKEWGYEPVGGKHVFMYL